MERKTDKTDLSYNDMVRGYGNPMIDVDHLFTEFVGNRKVAYCAIDRKHPNTKVISYDDPECDCRYALTAQRDFFTYDLRKPIPFYIMLNWTKPDNDPKLDHAPGPKMLYMIPGNYVAAKALNDYQGLERWFTPRGQARFINALRAEPGWVAPQLLKLSDVRHEYDITTRIDWKSITAEFEAERDQLSSLGLSGASVRL